MLFKIFSLNPSLNYLKLNNYTKPYLQSTYPSSKGISDMFISNSKKVSFKGSDPNSETIEWYDKNAENYFKETKDFSMKNQYPQLLKYIPKGGHILDAGCGSGRDSKEFIEMGYKVTTLEASKNLAKLASKNTGLQVVNTTFAKFKSDEKFDGIWACSSLLHIPKKDFEKSFINLTDHLKIGGVLWTCLKAGNIEEKDSKGRFFNYVSQDEMEKIISKHKDLELIEAVETANLLRPEDHPYINFVVKKK